MKKIIKVIELKPISVDYVGAGYCENAKEYLYTFSSTEYYNPKRLTFCEESSEPENMGEFRKLHDIESKQLLEWLNKNYK